MAGARTPDQQIEAGKAMDSALGRLLVVVENYPQLKSNEAFMQLMDEIAGTENRLATERMRYNQEVQGFNVMVKRFPTSLYAAAFNFGAAVLSSPRGGEGRAEGRLQRVAQAVAWSDPPPPSRRGEHDQAACPRA